MRPISVIIVFLYMLMFSLIGGVCIALSLGYLRADQIAVWLAVIQGQQRWRVICFGAGVGLLAIGLLIAQWIAGRFQRERTVAFNQPGRSGHGIAGGDSRVVEAIGVGDG